MNRAMIQALIWKEWRETRWKWLGFYLAFHIPAILGLMMFTFNQTIRFDIRVSTNSVVIQTLQAFLIVQSIFVVTAGLFLIAFFAAGSVAPEIDNRSMFYLFERPVLRWQILLLKFLVGAFQAMACVGLSIITTLTLGYVALLNVASAVTVSGTWHQFLHIVANGLRGTLWTSVIGVMIFAATFVFSVLFEKWWVGVIAGAISLIGMFYFLGPKIIEWLLANVIQTGKTGNIDLELYAQLDPMPIVIMLVLTVMFFFTAQQIFARKEMK